MKDSEAKIAQPLEVPNIEREALELLLQIPPGKVTTYQAIAIALGDPIASRAVGQIMAGNEEPERYPCYKVIHSNGEVGKYSGEGGEVEKIRRLRAEGIAIEGNRVLDLMKYLFSDFASDKPLKRLREIQEEMVAHLSLEVEDKEFQTVGGVDVSYASKAIAAYAKFDLQSKRFLGVERIEREVTFPYIPSYLAFRELPILQALLEKVIDEGRLDDVVMVDGNGILHPRHAGIASHLGVLFDIPTIGITKSLLCGEVDLEKMKAGEIRYVSLGEQKVGAAAKTSERAKPIFISPGHRIDLDSAIRVTMEISSHKLPEPIRTAHSLSREAVQQKREDQLSLDL